MTVLAVLSITSPSAWANLDGDLLRYHQDYGLYTSNDGDTLVWPPGTYELDEDGAHRYGFFLSGNDPLDQRRSRDDLTIEATGVTIIVTDPNIGVFKLEECHGLTIKGLTIDYDPLPWNQSTVLTKFQLGTDYYFDVALDPNYIPFDHAAFQIGFRVGTLFDPVTREAKLVHVFISDAQELGGGVWRLKLNPNQHPLEAFNEIDASDLYHQGLASKNAVDIGGSEPTTANPHPVTLDGVTIHAAGATSLALSACPTWSNTAQSRLLNCQIVKPLPDHGRLGTNHGGGFIISGCRVGPIIDNCVVQHTLDDALNMNGKARLFQGYAAGSGGGFDFSVADFGKGVFWNLGDRIQVFEPATGSVLYRNVVAITLLSANIYGPIRVTFDAAIPGMISDGTETGSTNAFNMNGACSGFDVRDSTWGKNRRHGAVLGGTGKFRRNVVEDTGGIGIVGGNFYVFNVTGPVPENLIIRNNTVRRCGRNFDAAIRVGAFKYDEIEKRAPADHQSADGIVVEGNTIRKWGTTYGIHLAAAKNSWVVGWNGGNPHDQRFFGSYPAGDRAILVGYPAGASHIEGVDATGSSGLDYAITIEHGVDPDVSVDLSKVYVTAPTQKLEDLR